MRHWDAQVRNAGFDIYEAGNRALVRGGRTISRSRPALSFAVGQGGTALGAAVERAVAANPT